MSPPTYRMTSESGAENKKAVRTDPGGTASPLWEDTHPSTGSESDLTAILLGVPRPTVHTIPDANVRCKRGYRDFP